MIVAERNGELLLTRQNDHARQAVEMARRWGDGSPERPRLNEPLLFAVENHDFGWHEPDAEILYDEESGHPVDFREVYPGRHVSFYRNGYEEALSHDPYSGLMVGMHWIGLYTRRFGYDPAFVYNVPDNLEQTFEDAISDQEKEWVGIKRKLWNPAEGNRRTFEEGVWTDYETLQVMDLLSLFVHLTDLKEENETIIQPYRSRPDDAPGELAVRAPGDGTTTLEPFPFDGAFSTNVTFRRIPDRRYESHKELRQILDKMPYETREVNLRSDERRADD